MTDVVSATLTVNYPAIALPVNTSVCPASTGVRRGYTPQASEGRHSTSPAISLSKNVEKRIKTEPDQPKTVTFRMTDFQNQKRNYNDWCSPSFYTSNKGYKMCIKVINYSTHVSLSAYLMKGDNDDSLSWPFTGTVTIELLNQLEDKNHHKVTTTFPAYSRASRRVVDRERAAHGRGLGWGNASKNTQYLKDDSLVFRVSGQPPDYKPWLRSTV